MKVKEIRSAMGAAVLSLAICCGAFSGIYRVGAETNISENLVSDGGFEEMAVGTQLPEKAGTTGFEVTSGTATVTDAMAATGAHGLEIVPANIQNNQACVNYYLPMEAGKRYCASARVYIGEEMSGQSHYGALYIRIDGNPWSARGTADDTAAKNGFVTMKTYFTATEDKARNRINIAFINGYYQYVDDISCYEVSDEPEPSPSEEPTPTPTTEPTPTPDDEMVIDGGFEKAEAGTSFPANANVGGFAVTGGTAEVTEENPALGAHAVKITPENTKGTLPSFNYYIELKNGKSYCASARVYVGAVMEDNTLRDGSVYIRFADTSNPWDARGVADETEVKQGYVTIRTFFTADKDYSRARVNVALYNGYYQYVDDVSCIEVGEIPEAEKITLNSISQNGDLPVVPTELTATVKFDGKPDVLSINTDKLTLNGAAAEAELTVSDDAKTVTVTVPALGYGKVYELSLGADGWLDKCGRALGDVTVRFKTTGKIYAESFDVYSGSAKISDGALKTGTLTPTAKNLKNMTDEEQSAVVLSVLYKDGVIAATDEQSIVLGAGEKAEELKGSIDVDDLSDGSYILKVFLWNSVEGGVSFADSITLK